MRIPLFLESESRAPESRTAHRWTSWAGGAMFVLDTLLAVTDLPKLEQLFIVHTWPKWSTVHIFCGATAKIWPCLHAAPSPRDLFHCYTPCFHQWLFKCCPFFFSMTFLITLDILFMTLSSALWYPLEWPCHRSLTFSTLTFNWPWHSLQSRLMEDCPQSRLIDDCV